MNDNVRSIKSVPAPAPVPEETDDGSVRRILLLSGPNLNLLGSREPDVYGTATLEDHVKRAQEAARSFGLAVIHLQSNDEAEMVDSIQLARRDLPNGRPHIAGIIINPGAFTHYAWALHDALAAYDGPIIELHLSNPNRREAWRHTSVISPVATATIAGLGGAGYDLAVEAMAGLLS